MSDSILQVNQIKDKGGNATGITIADSSANVTINNLTATTASIPAAAGSSLVFIAKVTASNSTSIEFKHGVGGVVMDNTYSNYIFQMTQLLPSVDNRHFTCNTMRGSSVSSSNRGLVNRVSTDKYAGGSTNVGPLALYATNGLFTADHVTNDTNHKLLGLSGTMTIPNPSATNVYKSATGQLVFGRDGDYMDCTIFSGLDYGALTAVDGVKFNFNSDNIASGTISMYGVKDA